MGRPPPCGRLGVSAGASGFHAGALHGVVRKKRHDEPTTPGGECRIRAPTAAPSSSTRADRKAFPPACPCSPESIEAYAPPLTHYDFLGRQPAPFHLVRRRLDILSCGMGERAPPRRRPAARRRGRTRGRSVRAGARGWGAVAGPLGRDSRYGAARLKLPPSHFRVPRSWTALSLSAASRTTRLLAVPRALSGRDRPDLSARPTSPRRILAAAPNGDRTVPPHASRRAPDHRRYWTACTHCPFSRRPHPSYQGNRSRRWK